MSGAGDTIDALIAREDLPASYKDIVEQHWRPLARKIADWRAEKQGPLVVGVNGAQGSGKSTLCAFLAEALLPELNLNAAILSLDDFYLPKCARLKLAEKIHPLLATRGVPGTHDVAMLSAAINDLLSGITVSTPVFDKASDDRFAQNRKIPGPADVILLEGWCVGAPAQDEAALTQSINALERNEDRDGIWRRYVNERLKTDYKDLFSRLDRLIMLRIDSMESVLQNRLRQERKLRAARPDATKVMTEEAIARFIQHYERLTRHCLDTLPETADIMIDVADLTANS
ncbi:kinase [Marinicaulis aureus]|uniref:Kinase n=1 Tax=Hyphococcus aureus TaxID=2666033 RepID=A0ABW1KXD4_9PROT